MTTARPPISFVWCAKRQPATPTRNLRLAPNKWLLLPVRSARILAAANYLVVMLKNVFKTLVFSCGHGRPARARAIRAIDQETANASGSQLS